jgi:hypothetical protein
VATYKSRGTRRTKDEGRRSKHNRLRGPVRGQSTPVLHTAVTATAASEAADRSAGAQPWPPSNLGYLACQVPVSCFDHSKDRAALVCTPPHPSPPLASQAAKPASITAGGSPGRESSRSATLLRTSTAISGGHFSRVTTPYVAANSCGVHPDRHATVLVSSEAGRYLITSTTSTVVVHNLKSTGQLELG